MEDHLQSTGLSYAILRPTVLFGKEDILINNIAWALRHLPVFGIYGDGRYRLQPIYVDDLAAAAVACITGETNETIDAIGPETFRYSDMVEMIAREIESRALIAPMPRRSSHTSVTSVAAVISAEIGGAGSAAWTVARPVGAMSDGGDEDRMAPGSGTPAR